MDRLLDVNQLSEFLQVKSPTIYGWVHQNLIPHYKIGRLVRFEQKEVLHWLEERHRKGKRRPTEVTFSTC